MPQLQYEPKTARVIGDRWRRILHSTKTDKLPDGGRRVVYSLGYYIARLERGHAVEVPKNEAKLIGLLAEFNYL